MTTKKRLLIFGALVSYAGARIVGARFHFKEAYGLFLIVKGELS